MLDVSGGKQSLVDGLFGSMSATARLLMTYGIPQEEGRFLKRTQPGR